MFTLNRKSARRSIIALTFFVIVSACQTIQGPSQAEEQEAEMLKTQKAVIVNFLNKGLATIALKELRDFIKTYPDDADFRNLMGLTQLALKNPNAAIGYFETANKLDPRIPFSLNLASSYIELGNYDKAIQVLQSLKNHPDYEDYKNPERIDHNLGLAFERQKKLPKAMQYYKAALANNPNFYISLMRLAHLVHNQKKYKEARKLFQQAKAVCHECFDPINGIALSFIAESKPQSAIIALKKYLKVQNLSKSDSQKAQHMIQMAQRFQDVDNKSY